MAQELRNCQTSLNHLTGHEEGEESSTDGWEPPPDRGFHQPSPGLTPSGCIPKVKENTPSGGVVTSSPTTYQLQDRISSELDKQKTDDWGGGWEGTDS